MADRKPPDLSWMRTLALVGQIGFVICIPVVAGTAAGVWLNRRIGGNVFLFLAPVFVGVAIGIFGAYRMLSKEIDWDR